MNPSLQSLESVSDNTEKLSVEPTLSLSLSKEAVSNEEESLLSPRRESDKVGHLGLHEESIDLCLEKKVPVPPNGATFHQREIGRAHV